MRSKDQILLENVYSKILNREAVEEVPVKIDEVPVETPFTKDHLEEREEESMAKSNLYSICKHAKALLDSLEAGAHLEPWQLEKIAVVNDNIQDVSQVAEYESSEFDISEIDDMQIKMEAKETPKNNKYAICRAAILGKDGEETPAKKEKLARCEKKVGAKIAAKKRKSK